MQLAKRCRWIIMFIVILSFAVQGIANVSIVRDPAGDINLPETTGNQETGLNKALYNGSVRIHIMEPVSRWKDASQKSYENAHLWYPLMTTFSVEDLSTWDTTVTWIGADHGFSNVSVDNIGAVGVVFNASYEVCDAYPPNGYWFTAYYADASATAHPGEPGQNMTPDGYTHSVYIEEGTATG